MSWFQLHGSTVTYAPFLVRVPLPLGRNANHTVTFTCTTAPCYIDYMASNGTSGGPKVLTPLFWVNGNYSSQAVGVAAAQNQNIINRFLVEQLSGDGLAVAAADTSGYLNYYANSANWANPLHPNNGGSAAQALALGARSQLGINPGSELKKVYEYTFSVVGNNGYTGSTYVGQINLLGPIKIESVSVDVAGTLHGCTGGTSTPEQVQIASGLSGAESYNYPFTVLGPNVTANLFNNHISGFGTQLTLQLTGATCTGTPVAGNENNVVSITYSRL